MGKFKLDEIRKTRWFKNLAFLLVLGILYFSGLPLWINVKVTSLQLNEAESRILEPYGESIYRMPINIVDASGQTIDISSFKGRPVFINFWASWCVPCLAEFSSLEDVVKDIPDIEFVFVNIEKAHAFEKFIKKSQYDLPFYNLKSQIPLELSQKSIPATFLIDKNGVVVYRSAGAFNWSSGESIDLLKQLIKA